MNVAVINIKDIVKYLVKAVIIILIIICFTRFFAVSEFNEISKGLEIEKGKKHISFFSYKYFLDKVIPNILDYKEEEKIKYNFGQKILNMELNLTKNVEKEITSDIENINESEEKKIEEVNTDTNVILAQNNLQTEVIEEKNLNAAYNNSYGSVKIKNKSNYELTEEMLIPEAQINKNKILLFHTHTCESYTPTEENNYEASGNYRTTDLNKSVVRVGTELENQLKAYGYNVIHDTTYHDYPAYTGSYDRSENTVKEILKENSDIQISFDIHRDAVRRWHRLWPNSKNR